MAASIALATVQLNLASNLSQYRSFPLLSELKVTPSIQGGVKRYASRTRIVTQGAVTNQIDLVLPQCDRDQIQWLTDHIGQLMLVRDDRGRKIWAAYFASPIDENGGDVTGNVTLRLDEVTYSEVI